MISKNGYIKVETDKICFGHNQFLKYNNVKSEDTWSCSHKS